MKHKHLKSRGDIHVVLYLIIAVLLSPVPALAKSPEEATQQLFKKSQQQFKASRYEKSLTSLNKAIKVAEKTENPVPIPSHISQLAETYNAKGEVKTSIDILINTIKIAEQFEAENDIAHLHYDLGVVKANSGQPSEEHFLKAFETGDDIDLKLNAAANVLKLNNRNNQANQIKDFIENAQTLAKTHSKNPASAQLKYQLATYYQNLAQQPIQRSISRNFRNLAFDQLIDLAKQEQLPSELTTYANARLGKIYCDSGDLNLCIEYANNAWFTAQANQQVEILFQIEWLLAQAFKRAGDTKKARYYYQQAVDSVVYANATALPEHQLLFSTNIALLYREYADQLLQQSNQSDENRLTKVRGVIERLKVVELEDYLDDQCLVAPQQSVLFDSLASNTATLYPILLPNRLELLVSIKGKLHQFTSPVTAANLSAVAYQFRSTIEARSDDYLPMAQQLHDWLIDPVEAALHENAITTLVIVPDGALRTIPLATLHNGKQFLVERYAIASTLGIDVLSDASNSGSRPRVFASGLTEASQGYSALPGVDTEINLLGKKFGASTVMDKAFKADTIKRLLLDGQYDVVHFATHGEFNSDYDKSFLLTHDAKYTMKELEETINLRNYRSEPLDLIVLSACQTAAGDDKAALGLAGIALRAGARSALASLWYISDKSTPRLMESFYDEYLNKRSSKAKALQMAQIELINSKEYSHPDYWAPFLVIGNWL